MVTRIIAVVLFVLAPLAANADADQRSRIHIEEATVAQLQAAMASGRLTSEALTRAYIARILAFDQDGPGVNSVMELNPDALAMARRADELRRRGRVLGPLHGIPVLLKGNIDTGDRMQTTAGSFGLAGAPAPRDSTVAAKLRAGGAVILGKTNLSEWANFRSFNSSSGWSAVGGQTNNPYGINRNPCGSSSGSGAAATANFAAVSLGTETDGSIVCPGNANGVVGHQAHGGAHQSRRRGAHLAHPGHGGAAWPHRGRRGDRALRHSEPHTGRARRRDGGCAARLARARAAHEHSGGLHAIPESRRPARCASRPHASGHRDRTGPGRRRIR